VPQNGVCQLKGAKTSVHPTASVFRNTRVVLPTARILLVVKGELPAFEQKNAQPEHRPTGALYLVSSMHPAIQRSWIMSSNDALG